MTFMEYWYIFFNYLPLPFSKATKKSLPYKLSSQKWLSGDGLCWWYNRLDRRLSESHCSSIFSEIVGIVENALPIWCVSPLNQLCIKFILQIIQAELVITDVPMTSHCKLSCSAPHHSHCMSVRQWSWKNIQVHSWLRGWGRHTPPLPPPLEPASQNNLYSTQSVTRVTQRNCCYLDLPDKMPYLEET